MKPTNEATHEIGIDIHETDAYLIVTRLADHETAALSVTGIAKRTRDRLLEIIPPCVILNARPADVVAVADSLNRDQVSLLLYVETLEVDFSGAIDPRRMNATDWGNLDEWKEEGFLDFGRIASKDLRQDRTHWVELTSRARSVAAELRARRAKRSRENRTFSKTSEL